MRKIEVSAADRPKHIDPGPAAMLQWIRIDQLVIDESYQRELKAGNWKSIKRIAARFKWSRFSPVFVAPIEGGAFAIIDGQHRTHAAAMCGFAEVPCQVVPMNQAEQAASFAAVNGMVTKVTTWQIYKAALSAGETWAVEACGIATEAGCRLMTNNASHWVKKPGEIYGIKGFRDVISQRNRDLVVKALTILMKAEGYGDNYEIWESSCLFPLVLALTERPRALAHPEFIRALEDFDFWTVYEADQSERRERIRRGLSYVPKKESLRAAIVDWMDRTFPSRVMLPAPEAAQ